MESNKINGFYNDFWFVRLRDLLEENVGKSRQHYLKVCAYWYILIELEGYSEEQIINELSSHKDQMKSIMEKWDVDSLAGFIERVHYIASARQINHFIEIVKNSSASEAAKKEIVDTIINEDIIETWHNKNTSKGGDISNG